MKTPEQLKKELHKYIESINDEETLMMVHEDISAYLKKGVLKKDEDDLTEEQKIRLEEAIRQADAGETMSFEEFKSKMDERHTKL